jgi:8-oxo-dGTP diphosphatase
VLQVVAGVLRRADGRVLLSQRPQGKHMAGRWELPGGKVHAGESLHDALVRELDEELGVGVIHSTPLIQLAHDYPDRHVVLHTREVTFQGEPVGREGQALQWVLPSRMDAVDLLEADAPIVTALRLPSRYVVTSPAITSPAELDGWLDRVLSAGLEALQLRAPGIDPAGLDALAARLSERLAGLAHVRWWIGGDPMWTVPLARAHGAAGVHLPARFADSVPDARQAGLEFIGVSCHDRQELCRAAALGADFAVLGPVRATSSHPQATGMGWAAFRDQVADVGLPVYAIGGLRDDDVGAAREAGGQGVAGIRGVGIVPAAGAAQ